MTRHYPNKYFTAIFVDLFEYNIARYRDVIFLKDVGPFKVGDRFPEGYISIILGKYINKIRFEMNTELGHIGPSPFNYEIDLFALT